MPKARIRLIEAKQQYLTDAEYLSEYLKDLAPVILNSLSGWYGRWEATFSKDGNTVLFTPADHHDALRLPDAISRGDGALLTGNAAKNDNGPFMPNYKAFELTWDAPYYPVGHDAEYRNRPFDGKTTFFLHGQAYFNGKGGPDRKHQFSVSTSGKPSPRELAPDIVDEFSIHFG